MAVIFVIMVCAAVSLPFIALAWAIKPRHCPNRGAEIEPDRDIVRVLTGR